MSVESSTQKIAAHYDKIDGHYDDIYSSTVCLAEDRVVMSLVRGCISNNSVILDVGCGTGLIPSYLNGNSYKGIDLSSTELKTAVKKMPKRTGSFIVADMHKLPVPTEAFDFVVSTYGPFSYSQDPERARDEILRPLKPGKSFLLMPYTKRTGMAVGLGGYSTAVDGEVSRIYYTENEAGEVFGCLEDVNFIGINYLANLILEKLDGKDFVPEITDKFLAEQLTFLINRMGEGANAIRTDNNLNFGKLADLWRKFRHDRQNIEVMTEILTEEIRIFNGVLPAHFARHMVITGKKKF